MQKTEIKTIGEYLAEIMRLAYEVNSQTQYCVFVRFSGHVDAIDIDVGKSKKEWSFKLHRESFYYAPKSYDKSDEIVVKKLENEIKYLRYLLDDSKVILDNDKTIA